jgi:hypothetical protein
MTITPWEEVEITLTAQQHHDDPYTQIECRADFVSDAGAVIRRPAFWDGNGVWKVRFASPTANTEWRWASFANVTDAGLAQSGGLRVGARVGAGSRYQQRGFLRMSAGRRNLVHADGTPMLMVADTAWALPFRATPDQCALYAAKRASQGFNAVLLMSLQPDMKPIGTGDRSADGDFDVAFDDLRRGRLEQIRPGYFQKLDRLIRILLDHGLMPVYQPVFHGYGWMGGDVAGPVLSDTDYARYCRYLVARYGARPAMWLLGGDGHNRYSSIDAAGQDVERWDAYQHPTGLHYCPHGENNVWQDREWLDFQWCQTGHNAEHLQERVADMWRNTPTKAVANGEPTYEHMGAIGKAAAWWQGHEGWSNLCAGGTMGVVYGAGSLWQWRLHADEPQHQAWAHAPGASWLDALHFDGANHVGVIGRIFEGLPFADMQPNWTYTYGRRALSVPGELFIVYLPTGGYVAFVDDRVPDHYRVVDPLTGSTVRSGRFGPGEERVLRLPEGPPSVIVCTRETVTPAIAS